MTRVREAWPWPVLVLIGLGALLRLILLAITWKDPLDLDAGEYLLLARRYSFADPWSASFREPLWRALVKIATSPFDYSPHAQRVFTVLISIAVLPLAWVMFRKVARVHGLSDRIAIVGVGVIALSAQTIREAPRGLREDLCMLLFLVFSALLLVRPRGWRQAVGVAIPIALLSVIRWELATFAAFIALLFAIARRASWLTPLAAIVAIAVVSGPWLIANDQKHGSLAYNSEVHATYYWKQEQPASVRAQYRSAPADDPPVHFGWSQYYLDYLGPGTTAKRFVTGYVKVTGKLLASQVVPRGAAVSTLGRNQHSRGWQLALALVGVVFVGVGVWLVVRLRRSPPLPSVFWETVAIVALAICPYAALANLGLEMRVLMFTVPLLGLTTGIVVDTLLRGEAVNVRRQRERVS
jgi:hypothetical protein